MTYNNKVITKYNCNYKVSTNIKNIYKVITFLSLYNIVITSPSFAFTLPDDLSDGSLVYGHLDKNETLFIKNNYLNIGKNDKNLTQIQSDKNGNFVIGLPQDLQQLHLTLKQDGQTINKVYPITPQKWKEEVVTGLQPEKVSPSSQNNDRIAREASEIRLARQTTNYDTLPTNWIKPIKEKHRISSFFGSRRILNGIKKQGHSGVDYAAPAGTQIIAPADGKVVYINPDVFLTGKTVMIDHGFGVFSSYSHLNDITVQFNQNIKQGDEIGHVGSTGRSSGPHLHFTVTWFGVRIDPECLYSNHKTTLHTSKKNN